MKLTPALLPCLLAALATSVPAWDVSGHIIVAKIAYDHTSAHARQKMDQLGPQLTFDVTTQGHMVHHTYNGVNLAAWPDNVKHASKKQTPFAAHFGDWHFVDIGLSVGDPNPLEEPHKLSVKSGDALQGLLLALDVIQHHKSSELVPNEAVALALVCHLVGDIHQPLHCTTHYSVDADGSPESDAGGNAVIVVNFQDKYAELHQFWDTAYKMTYDATNRVFKATGPLSTFAMTPTSPQLVQAAASISSGQAAVDTSMPDGFLRHWIDETHRIGVAIAYGRLGDDYKDNKVTLEPAYGQEARRIAERQIHVAGLRLAALLKALYP